MIFAVGMILAIVGTIAYRSRVREEIMFGPTRTTMFFFVVAVTGWILMVASLAMLAWRYLP